jgi:hypothetical protein
MAHHQTNFKNTTNQNNRLHGLLNEVTDILQHLQNFIKGTGYLLSCSWYPAINMIKEGTAITKD